MGDLDKDLGTWKEDVEREQEMKNDERDGRGYSITYLPTII